MKSRADWFAPKFRLLKKFAYAGLVGFVLLIGLGFSGLDGAIIIVPMLLILPLLFWLAFIPVLHWKDRYYGQRPNIWGAFLVFETSGWTKILYWFMHVLPDHNKSGRYTDRE